MSQYGEAVVRDYLAAQAPPGSFERVPESTGTDRNQRLSIVVDSARQVVDAQVLDVDHLRRPRDFVDAVQEAFSVADGERAVASLTQAGRAEDFLARAEETFSGASPAQAPPRPDVSRAAIASRRVSRDDVRRREPLPAVTADNGYLTVRRGADGRLQEITVDADWLSAATAQQLQRALVQAARFDPEVRA